MLASYAALTLIAQVPIQPNLDGFTYPALARAARIQGTVQFLVKSDGIQLLLGHPLLAPAARSNLEKWATPYALSTPLSITYIFRLTVGTGPQIVEVNDPIGDSFDRFFLRLFHLPVTRRLKVEVCRDSNDRSTGFKNGMKDDLPTIEIDVEAGVISCPEPALYATR
jgi:hypothetical protein